MNEIILAFTWFKSPLAWSRGRVPILGSLRNQAEIKVFISESLSNALSCKPQFPHLTFFFNVRTEGNDCRGSFPPVVINEPLWLVIQMHSSGMLWEYETERCSEILERIVPRRQGSSLGIAPAWHPHPDPSVC